MKIQICKFSSYLLQQDVFAHCPVTYRSPLKLSKTVTCKRNNNATKGRSFTAPGLGHNQNHKVHFFRGVSQYLYRKGLNYDNNILKVPSPIAFNIVQFADLLKKKKNPIMQRSWPGKQSLLARRLALLFTFHGTHRRPQIPRVPKDQAEENLCIKGTAAVHPKVHSLLPGQGTGGGLGLQSPLGAPVTNINLELLGQKSVPRSSHTNLRGIKGRALANLHSPTQTQRTSSFSRNPP